MQMLKKLLISIAVIIIVILILVPLTYELAYAEKIYPGIKIGQIDVGNRTPQAAKELFQALTNQNNQVLKIVHPTSGQIWEIKPQEIDLTFNLENSVQSAYLVGRQGTPLKKLSDKKRAWRREIATSKNMIFSKSVKAFHAIFPMTKALIWLDGIKNNENYINDLLLEFRGLEYD